MCSLKLADLGARVIKIERPGQGDLCRTLYLSDTEIGGTNSLFHAINRNKESFTADLRDEGDRAMLRDLVDPRRCGLAELPPRRDRTAGLWL